MSVQDPNDYTVIANVVAEEPPFDATVDVHVIPDPQGPEDHTEDYEERDQWRPAFEEPLDEFEPCRCFECQCR